MYVSTLFKLSRRWAERFAERWFILSAKHGLLTPDKVIEPYNQTLNTMSKVARLRWGIIVSLQLRQHVPRDVQLVGLCGRNYLAPLQGVQVHDLMHGMPIGRRLQFLKEELE